MNISRKLAGLGIVAVLVVGMAVGFWVSRGPTGTIAHEDDGEEVDDVDDEVVDAETLDELYDAIFHRPVDLPGRGFHLGRRFKDVLRDFRNSQELRYYGALFKAVKAYEEAVRAPGELSAVDKQRYLDAIDSALATLLAWVETLPDQNYCKAVVDHERARQAIQEAFERMNEQAKEEAEHGVFNASRRLGRPLDLPAPLLRCFVTSSPSPTVSPSPTITPTATPTPTPIATPSPTPTLTPTPTP